MKIGIIGAGQIGGTLTRRLTQLGHEVFVASRGPSSLTGLANETGAKAVTVREAARAGQVVVVTIPEAHIRDLPKHLFEGVPSDVVVIDKGLELIETSRFAYRAGTRTASHVTAKCREHDALNAVAHERLVYDVHKTHVGVGMSHPRHGGHAGR